MADYRDLSVMKLGLLLMFLRLAQCADIRLGRPFGSVPINQPDVHQVDMAGAVEGEELINGNKYFVDDGCITASSSYRPPEHGPQCSRIGGTLPDSCYSNGWLADYDAPGPKWIQVDLGCIFDIYAVATQGRGTGKYGNKANQWVTTYNIAYQAPGGTQFVYYMDRHNGDTKDLTGNVDCDTIHKNRFDPLIRARLVRLYPVSWYDSPALRLELYGK